MKSRSFHCSHSCSSRQNHTNDDRFSKGGFVWLAGQFLGLCGARKFACSGDGRYSLASGPEIPPNFVGLSFGMKALLPNRAGAHFFSPTNAPLITLFQNLGLHSFARRRNDG